MSYVVPLTEETPPPRRTLVTGHFHEGPQYAAWRTRGTHDYLLLLTQTGTGRVGGAAAGSEITTQAGDLILLRPHTRHDYGTAKNASEWTFIWAHFVPRPHWAVWLEAWPNVLPGVFHLALPESHHHLVEAALLKMHERAQSGLFHRDALALNALEEALLWCDSASPSSHPDRCDPRIMQAMQFLLENVSQPVSLDQTARAVGISPSRLVHLFRQQTGQTMGQFVENERMARAKQLLALTSRTVAAIACEVGYENPFYFSLRFKKCVGASPTEWRMRERDSGAP